MFLLAQKKIIYQIKVYSSWRIRKGITDGDVHWLKLFTKITKVDDAYDATQEDVFKFLEYVSVVRPGQFALDQAKRAINNFLRYYNARGKTVVYEDRKGYTLNMKTQTKTKPTNKPKLARNKQIVELRRKGMGWKALGKKFNLHYTTVREIYLTFNSRFV